jgi:hypothetical protein
VKQLQPNGKSLVVVLTKKVIESLSLWITEPTIQQIKQFNDLNNFMFSPITSPLLNVILGKRKSCHCTSFIYKSQDLSAALWARNKLDYSDKVQYGFYEFGRAKQLWSLSQLQQQPMNQDTEVLLHDIVDLPTGLDSLPKMDPVTRVKKLAQFISDRFGGTQDYAHYNHLFYLPELNNLKHQLKSNVIPISKVIKGACRHRAFMCKILCDMLSIPCTLERGSFEGNSHCWNSVCFDDKHYVVDLIHSPGALYEHDSLNASNYKRIPTATHVISNKATQG